MSSRSSSVAASSLRLVKMSTMPRPMLDDERDRPEPEPLEPAPLRRWSWRHPDDRRLGDLRPAASARRGRRFRLGGRGSAAEPAAHEAGSCCASSPSSLNASSSRRARRSVRRRRTATAGRPSLDAMALVLLVRPSGASLDYRYVLMTPEETRARAALSRRPDAGPRQAGRRSPCIGGRRAGPASRTISTRLRFGLPRKPALAHRLDRDTAGCLVLGRHHKALEKLGLLFKQGKIAQDLLGGRRRRAGGGRAATIDLPLGRLDDKRGWWMKVDPAGLPAQHALARAGARRVARRADRVAGARAADRPHPSIARPLRRAGLADPRRRDLRRARRTSRCSCSRARSWCRFKDEGRRSSSRRRRRRTCARRSRPAGLAPPLPAIAV